MIGPVVLAAARGGSRLVCCSSSIAPPRGFLRVPCRDGYRLCGAGRDRQDDLLPSHAVGGARRRPDSTQAGAPSRLALERPQAGVKGPVARKRPPRKRTRSHRLAGSLIPSLGFGRANHANRVMLAHRAQRHACTQSTATEEQRMPGPPSRWTPSRSTRPLPEPSPVAGSAESSRVIRPLPETREGGAARRRPLSHRGLSGGDTGVR